MGHQAVCVNLAAQLFFPPTQIVKAILIILIRCKYDLPVVAALDDVVRITHYKYSYCSWHVQPLTKYSPLDKINNNSVPFFLDIIMRNAILTVRR